MFARAIASAWSDFARATGRREHLRQDGESAGVVGDAALRDQNSVLVDQGDVVVALGPVDTAEHSQPARPP